MKKIDIESKMLAYIIGPYKIYTTEETGGKISFSIINFVVCSYKSINIDRSIVLKNLDPSAKLKQFKKVIKDNYTHKENGVCYLQVPFKMFEIFITNLYKFYDNNK